MKLYTLGLTLEQPLIPPPESLTKEKAIKLVKEGYDYAFGIIKREYLELLKTDPVLVPTVIACLCFDHIYGVYKINEEEFKAGMFHYKVWEEPEVNSYVMGK